MSSRGRLEYEYTYNLWWKGKLCRANSGHNFKRVREVKYHAPPSGIYGTAELIFEDGTSECVQQGNAFRPRKRDVEIKEE